MSSKLISGHIAFSILILTHNTLTMDLSETQQNQNIFRVIPVNHVKIQDRHRAQETSFNSEECIKRLEHAKESGLDLNACTDQGETLCHRATDHDLHEVLAWLKESGADMNVIAKYGYTPLHLAIHKYTLFAFFYYNHVDITKENLGDDLSEREYTRYEELIQRYLKTIDVLLKCGTRLDIKTGKHSLKVAPGSHPPAPSGSTVFDIVYSEMPRISRPLYCILLNHGLLQPQAHPLTPQALIYFLYCLKKKCPDLYTSRFNILMPYLAPQLSPGTLRNMLCSSDNAASCARNLLQRRAEHLKPLLSYKLTSGELTYDDTQLATFIKGIKNNTVAQIPDTNIFKLAYELVKTPQSPQPKGSWMEQCVIL